MYEKPDEHRPGHVSVSEARDALADILNRVAYGGERVRLVRRGREIAAVVPVRDAELLEAIEDEMDLAAVREVLADPESAQRIPWEEIRTGLDL